MATAAVRRLKVARRTRSRNSPSKRRAVGCAVIDNGCEAKAITMKDAPRSIALSEQAGAHNWARSPQIMSTPRPGRGSRPFRYGRSGPLRTSQNRTGDRVIDRGKSGQEHSDTFERTCHEVVETTSRLGRHAFPRSAEFVAEAMWIQPTFQLC